MLIRSTLMTIAILAGLAATSITADASQTVDKKWLQEQQLKKEQKQRHEQMLQFRHRMDMRRRAADAAQQKALEADLQRERERNRELEANLTRQRAQADLQREREHNLQTRLLHQRARDLKAACVDGNERACIGFETLRTRMRPMAAQ